MSHLNPNATEWKPSGNSVHGMADLALPPATAQHESAAAASPGTTAVAAPAPSTAAPAAGVEASPMSTPPVAGVVDGSASASPFYVPSYMAGADPDMLEQLAHIDWDAEFKKLMELTGQMIDRQLSGQDGDERSAAAAAAAAARQATTAPAIPSTAAPHAAGVPPVSPPTATTAAAAAAPLPLTYASAVKSATVAARKPMTMGVASSNSAAAAAAASSAAAAAADMDDDGVSMAGTAKTGASKHHWKKLTKAQQRLEQSQRNAFEAFANALLHSVSPFMAPLRARCKTSLPHIKVDQRFGKSGHPETAIAQFLVAPLVTNYRPRHFHDVAPGELMEFHYDFALVLQALPSAYAIHIGYGPTWKRYAVPYCYVACREYRKEVLTLCPEEIPNSRSDAIYEDDVVKDITELLLKRGEGLEMLETMSIVDAMRKRVDLYPLYDAFATVFQTLENYQVEISDIRSVPSRFLVKASRLAVEAMPQPIILDDEVMWDELPEVSRVLVESGVAPAATAADSSAARPASTAPPVAAAASAAAKSNAAPVAAAATAAPAAPAAKASAPPSSASAGGSAAWQTAAPLVVSAACVAATVAVVLLKKRR